MAIPLVGSPPIVPNFEDLIEDLLTGQSANFIGGNGDWSLTDTGTLSNDTTIAYMWPSNNTGSLKLVSTTVNEAVEVSLYASGRIFKAGLEYTAYLVVTVEENSACDLQVEFGHLGTDDVTVAFNSTSGADAFVNGRFACLVVRWIPSSDTPTCTLRLRRTEATGTRTLHISYAKVHRSLLTGAMAVLATPETNAVQPAGGMGLVLQPSTNGVELTGGAKYTGGLGVQKNGGVTLESASDGSGDPYNGMWLDQAGFGLQAEANFTPGDLADAGINMEVGTDYIGFYISEADSDTVQFYADVSAGYMMQLRNRGSGKGWAVSDDGSVNARIESYFDYVLRVAGTLSVATDVADYLLLSRKAIIDEVHAHVGTAPTGQALIVDVNDDGTTIFTTQGNRPQIAASANDDTSGTPDGGTAVAAGSVITVDVDQVGSGTAGADLYVSIRGRYIW